MARIYEVGSFQPREGVGHMLSRARKTYILALEQQLAPHDITASQWAVILNIADGHASTAGELAKLMRYSPGAMTRLLDRVERKGFIRRRRTGNDRRSIQLELTASGRALRPRIVEAQVSVLNRLLEGFSRAELRQLHELLGRIANNAEALRA